MAERAKLMKEMLEIGQSLGFKGAELQQYMEQQVKVAENQTRDERAARRVQEQEKRAQEKENDKAKRVQEQERRAQERKDEKLQLERKKQHLQLQIAAKEAKAEASARNERDAEEARAETKARIRRESAKRNAAIERGTAEIQARLALQRLDRERELLELKNQAAQEKDDDDEHAEKVRIQYKAIRPTIPAFKETKDDIDAYLQRYEKVTEVNKWPETDWALHLSTLLTGQALALYARLPAEEARDHKELKAALLRRYELTIDEFRKRFHEARRDIDETATEFLGRSSGYLTRWVELAGIEQTYDQLFDLIVREQFVSTCEPHLEVFLREKKLTSVKEVGKAADLYLDARKYSNYKSEDKVGSTPARPGLNGKPDSFDKPGSSHADNVNNKRETKDTRVCFTCNTPGHISMFCKNRRTASASSNQPRSDMFSVKAAWNNACVVEEERPTSTAGGVDLQEIVVFAGTIAGQCRNLQNQAGLVGEQAVTVMRDTGGTGAVVNRSLTNPEQLTGTS